MNILYKLLFTCFIACAALSAAAQSDYRPGYVVMSQGDTLHGLVSYRSSALTDNICGFKKDEQAAVVTYTSNDIAGYGFPNDKNFKTKALDHADTLAVEQVFMEELVRGTVSLYNYKGTFFVEKQNDKLHKLYITQEEYTNKSGVLAKRQINHHIRVLNTLMQDCSPMLSKIERIKLAQKNMVELVQEYNRCAGGEEQTTFKESKPWIALRPGITGGISHTSLNFSAKDERYLHLEHASFNTNTSPTFGLALLVNSPRINEHASLLLEGRYHLTGNYKAAPSYTWFETYYDNEIEFDLAALKLTTALRYDFSGKTTQPFVNAGGFINMYQQRDYKHRQNVRRTSTSTPEKRINDSSEFVGKYQQGLLAGAGTYINVNKRRLSVEARYELGLDLHDHTTTSKINQLLDSNTKTISLLLGLYF